ncbi:hypothetical protein BTRA_5429 [Burkholderia thailandensis USAMRU Malaysia |nr:hypothetical protein BTQ_3670 [Burkholderia thailandensis 2002721723]AHI80683.1 hypothetical protein BTJ_4703 [Burkholderia thailandensis E444]AIC89185.1 hypothetical protein BTRA_5429 [Burkholderia thailandensis USAMRU Malaysia \
MLQPLASLRRRQEKTHRADAADGTRPDGVLPTNRLRSTEPSGCASRTVRLPSDLRHGNARNGAPLRLPHPLRFFCRVCIYRYVFATRQARIKHSPCRSTTANSDYILVPRYRHEMTNGAPHAGSANPPAPAIVGANRPPVRDTARRAARSRFFPEACIKLISLKSACQTFLVDTKKCFTPITGGESLSACGRNRAPCRVRTSASRRAVSPRVRFRRRKWRLRKKSPPEYASARDFRVPNRARRNGFSSHVPRAMRLPSRACAHRAPATRAHSLAGRHSHEVSSTVDASFEAEITNRWCLAANQIGSCGATSYFKPNIPTLYKGYRRSIACAARDDRDFSSRTCTSHFFDFPDRGRDSRFRSLTSRDGTSASTHRIDCRRDRMTFLSCSIDTGARLMLHRSRASASTRCTFVPSIGSRMRRFIAAFTGKERISNQTFNHGHRNVEL